MRNPILEMLAFEPESGKIALHGVRYLLVRPETLVAIQRSLEADLGAAAARILEDAGRLGGATSARRFLDAFPDRARSELLDWFCELGTDFGWGRLRLDPTASDSPGSFAIEVAGGPVATAYGEGTAQPVCHLLRGVLAGIGEVLLDGTASVVERSCAAVTPGPCRFVVRRVGTPVPFPTPRAER